MVTAAAVAAAVIAAPTAATVIAAAAAAAVGAAAPAVIAAAPAAAVIAAATSVVTAAAASSVVTATSVSTRAARWWRRVARPRKEQREDEPQSAKIDFLHGRDLPYNNVAIREPLPGPKGG
jgi:hypothetical protein